MKLIKFFSLCVIAVGGFSIPFANYHLALAGDVYPSKPIRIVIGYGPGGVADITARMVAQKMSDSMGQQVIVDNRPSAGGIVAGETVVKADPDGYTLLHMNYGNAVSAAIFKKMPYDIKSDFEPVSPMGFFDVAVLVDESSDIKTLQDLILKAKANRKSINVGSVSIGSGQNMAANLFKSMTGLPIEIIPYKETSSLFMALRSKDIDAAFEVISPAMPFIKSGKLRALAISSSKRFNGLPLIPTLNESGVKGYEVIAWNGIAVPARTPKAIIERLNKEVNAALAQPDVIAKFQELGIEARGGTPEDLRTTLAAEVVKWNNLVSTMKMEKQ